MNPKVLKELTEKTRALIGAPTCSSETKEAAKRWLDAVGTDAEAEETKKYIAELEEDIMPIDTLIAFAGSEQGISYFGAEAARKAASREYRGKPQKARCLKSDTSTRQIFSKFLRACSRFSSAAENRC